MFHRGRIRACLAAAAATAAVGTPPASGAIWVTVEPARAPVGATVRAHAEYVPEPVRLFLAPERAFEASSDPVLVTVGDGIELEPSGASAFRVGTAPSTMLEEIEEGRADLVFAGELAADDGEAGTSAFTVPEIPAGTYRILVHCASCAGDGGSLLWGETLVVEGGRSAVAKWLLIGGATGVAVLVAAGIAAWVARRRRTTGGSAETPA